MAKVLVNVMGDPLQNPIDVSELRKLSPEDRAITNAFLDWAYVNRHVKLDPETIENLKSWFRPTRFQP